MNPIAWTEPDQANTELRVYYSQALLTTETSENVLKNGVPVSDTLRAIIRIDGVAQVFGQANELLVRKTALVFDWQPVHDRILEILAELNHCSPADAMSSSAAVSATGYVGKPN